jgi:hypothetical protein
VTDEPNLLNELEDPDDRDTDYGRGRYDGAKAMAAKLRAEYERLRLEHERRGLYPAALAYTGAVASINAALMDLDADGDDQP